MSLQEKRWWTYAATAVAASSMYFLVVLPQVPRRPVDEIEFQAPLLLTGVAGALVGAVVKVVLSIASDVRSPSGSVREDERDRDVHRFGEYVAGIVLAAAMGVPFILAMLEADPFWIANTMYLAFALGALAGCAAKLVVYRRGF